MLIICRLSILIPNQESDWGSQGLSRADPGEKFDRILFPSARTERELLRTSSGELCLDESLIHGDACRATFDHAADSGAMRLPKRNETKNFSENIAGHNGKDTHYRLKMRDAGVV